MICGRWQGSIIKSGAVSTEEIGQIARESTAGGGVLLNQQRLR